VSQEPRVAKLVALLKSKTPYQTYQALKVLATEIPLHLPEHLPSATPAAVVIPIIQHPSPTILLTMRTSHLRHHAGQTSFPGGSIDEQDRDAKSCALRELFEEVGISQDQVEIIGELGQWPSYSGYQVSPFIGLITPPFTLMPCSHEVQEVYEIPLEIALDIGHYSLVKKETPIPHHYFEMQYQNKKIWGFTASILVLLAKYLASS
jgi:8-oxo-dGTP pyrophosphatase MutT (NUDIX family)